MTDNFKLKKAPLFVRVPADAGMKRRGWAHRLTGIGRSVLLALGGIFLGLIVLVFLVSAIIVHGGVPEKGLPGKFVLDMTLDGDYPEYQLVSGGLSGGRVTMLQLVNAMDHAGRDKRVKGLVVDLEQSSLSLGHIEEFRTALIRFRRAGKFAYIYAPSYGDPGRGLGTYYLASAFDQVWMQPVGVLSMAGVSAEMPYGRGALDKLGVQPEFFQRKEYKSLFESFNNHEMSATSREELTSLLHDIGDRLVGGIAGAKNMRTDAVRALMNEGMFTDTEALRAGLVTKLGDYDDLKDMVRITISGNADKKTKTKNFSSQDDSKKAEENDKLFVDIDRYAADNKNDPGTPGFKGKKTAALVYITGTIGGPPVHAPGFGEEPASENVTDDLLAIADDPDVNVLVLRIDSPGGSPSAAETIRRAAMRCKEKGKKIIVSMGDEAASGGYWIATAGDYIFALPDTLTGSIGVAGGKFALNGFWNKLGINWQSVDYGANAGMWSFNKPFTASGTERVNAMMDEVYNNFIGLVAKSRHMTVAQADAVARGRVWSGSQAKARNLVDEIGGLDATLDYAAKQAGAQDRTHMTIEVFPRPQSPLEKLEDLAGQVRAGGMPDAALTPELREIERAVLAGQYMAYQPWVVR